MMKTKGLNMNMGYGFGDGDIASSHPSSQPRFFAIVVGWYSNERFDMVVIGINVESTGLKFGVDNLRGDVADLSKIIVRFKNGDSIRGEFHNSIDLKLQLWITRLCKKFGAVQTTVTYVLASGFKIVSKEEMMTHINDLDEALALMAGDMDIPLDYDENVDYGTVQRNPVHYRTDTQLLAMMINTRGPLRIRASPFTEALMYAGFVNLDEFVREVEHKFKGYGYPNGVEIEDMILTYCDNKYACFREWLCKRYKKRYKGILMYYKSERDKWVEEYPGVMKKLPKIIKELEVENDKILH